MAEVNKTDKSVTEDVNDSLSWDSRVDASKITVAVDRGVVTLTGTVPSYSARAAATEDAWVIAGVRDIKNQLQVDYREEAPSDSEIKSNIVQAFTSDNELYPFDLNVTVGEGWVTLEGTVDTFWKKVRAEDLALGMRGVIDLTNKIAVTPTQTITDETLAETIIHALDRNIYVDVDDIDVTVENGTVTLSGAVPSQAAKRAAHDIARFTLGVKEVKDRITVRVLEEVPQK